jgi:hypothetical protein
VCCCLHCLLLLLLLGVGASAEPKQRAHWWYMLFFTLAGAEAALTANDWALFEQVMGQGCSQQQVQQYISALSQPGGQAGPARCRGKQGSSCHTYSCGAVPLTLRMSAAIAAFALLLATNSS